MKLLVKELTFELVGPRNCLQGWMIWEPEASNTLLAARNCFSTLHDMWNNVKAVARIAHQVSSSGASLVWAFASWQCWRRSGDQNYTSNCHFCPSEAIFKGTVSSNRYCSTSASEERLLQQFLVPNKAQRSPTTFQRYPNVAPTKAEATPTRALSLRRLYVTCNIIATCYIIVLLRSRSRYA